MKILKQPEVFGMNDQAEMVISINVQSIRESGFINFTGLVYADRKWSVFKSIQNVLPSHCIVTDQDLIAHDSYIEFLDKKTPIIFIINEGTHKSSFDINDKTIYGASKKRLERAMEKLGAEGFSCVYLVSTVKKAESLIKKHQNGTLGSTVSNVFNLFTKKAV